MLQPDQPSTISYSLSTDNPGANPTFTPTMENILQAQEALPQTNWKLRALGGPQSHEGFEPSLRQVIAQTGSAEMRDARLETPDKKRWRVAVSISRPESTAPGMDFFDITFTGRLSETAPASTATVQTAITQEFLHKLSHDLRTPLSALQLWIKVISEGEEEIPPGIRDGLEAIRECADEQQRLIASLISRPPPA